MTPYTAAYNFFAALVAIPAWKTLTPTQAAHDVQVNADPGYYTRYWRKAVTIFDGSKQTVSATRTAGTDSS